MSSVSSCSCVWQCVFFCVYVQHLELSRDRSVPVRHGRNDHAADAAQGHCSLQSDGWLGLTFIHGFAFSFCIGLWSCILLGLALCLPSASVFGLNGAVYKKLFFAYILLFIFQWAAPGGIGAWHGCTVSEMTYSVSSGTLNFTIPFHLTVHSCCWFQLKYSPSNWLLLLSCIAIQMR